MLVNHFVIIKVNSSKIHMIGVDDAMAVMLALLSPNECKVEAITTVAGNVPLEQATENVFRFMNMFQKVTKNTTNEYHPLPKVFKGTTFSVLENLIRKKVKENL